MLCEMRTMSCGTTRPAPRFRCPTSLLPICPAGSPTASPDASSSVRGARSHRRCQTGVAPSSMALPSRPGRNPQPSRTIRTTGVRAPRRVVILKGMQCSRALRLLPVVVSLAASAAVAQQRWRVANDGAWFYQTAGGKRLARLARGAILLGAVKDDWVAVTMEGWIFAASVGTTDRDGYNLAVTRAPEENLRSAPAGALVAKLAQGFLLSRVDTTDRWVHVRRDGFVSKDDLELIPETAQAPGLRPGVTDTTPRANPAAPDTTATDPVRALPTRRTTVYRAPDGPALGALAPETPLRILSRSGEWSRVQFEGWVKSADLQPAPAGVLVGVSAAELRADPQRYTGQVLKWTVQYVAIETADDLRPDIPDGTTYVLARGPLPERGFVYIIIPEARKADIAKLTPLATIGVTVRVRVGRSRYIGNPVVDLVGLEAQP